MLYHLYEASRALAEPMAQLAGAWAALLDGPLLPGTQRPLARRAAAGCELLYRLGKRYPRPAFDLGPDIAEETVSALPFCRLLHFRKHKTRSVQPAVLLAAPLSGHHATLLRDTVRALLEEHDVYITEWLDGRTVPPAAGPFGLDDYVAYLGHFIRLLGPALHVVAVCQSSVPLLGAVALMAGEGAGLPRSMTLIGGPIDTRVRPTEVDRLAQRRPHAWFRDTMVHTVPPGHPGAGRRVYPGFLQHACFVAMNPGRHAASHREFYEQRCRGEEAVRYAEFYDEYNATLDLPAEFYLDTIDTVFQRCLLARGLWRVAGRLVRPQDIREVALLTIEGERDEITAPGQTAAAHALCSGIPAARKRSYVAPDCGHYAIFSGRHWRETICPMIGDFIRCHETLPKAA